MTTIVLADDHQILRQGLRRLLETEPDFSIVGEAEDGLQVVKLVAQLNPDILVLDLMMPHLNGLEVARQVRQQSPDTRIVILSMHSSEAYVLEALRNGVSAYVLKDCKAEHLVRAIHTARAGGRYLSPPLTDQAVASYVQKAEAEPLDVYETLTKREREVLQLAAEGCTNTQVAEHLFISARTAEKHRASMMRKLDLANQTALVCYAIRRGILLPEK